MKQTETALMDLLCTALKDEKPADPGLSPEEWETLLRCAEAHKLLPLVLDAAWSLPSCRAALRRPAGADAAAHAATVPPAPDWRGLVFEQLTRQAVQENEFLNLVLALRERGLEPVVLKGPVLRALWPKPLLRPSVDDDILVSDAEAPAFHAALLELGLTADDPKADPARDAELSYHRPNSPLYIEMHRRLFDPDSEPFSDFNAPFADALLRTVPIQVQDVTLRTLAPTDQLLFLILHAFKHFLFSGFGLRVAADLCLFAQRYAAELDLDCIAAECAACRCERFAAAVFRIGEKHLGIPAPAAFTALEIDETALLDDMMAAGLHGAEIDRLHSANITLAAAANAGREGKRPGGLRSAAFLPADKLSGRYPWLKKQPWLLPAAWTLRGADYLLHRKKYGKQSPAASLRIGKERVRLLEEYGVIDKK